MSSDPPSKPPRTPASDPPPRSSRVPSSDPPPRSSVSKPPPGSDPPRPAASRPPRATPPWMARIELPVTTPRVVVADDDRVTREIVAGLLRGHGLEVETVENGKQAVDRVGQGGVDLVLLDIVMPGLSGIDCCRLIKSMTAESFLPVMLVTAKTDTESRVEGLRIGADDYVCKPFDERELFARVNAMLRIKRLHDHVQESRARLETLAVMDELTGLYNYRYLHTRLGEEFKRAERYRDPLACAMVDIDHFKEFNDKHGHDTGDAVLREVAQRLKGGLREIDVVARYGGEEFLLVLPSTHFAGALTVADRIWRGVGATPILADGKAHRVTVSVGVALYPSRDIRSKDQLLKAADRALYQAKDDGRDRICVFQHQGYIYRPSSHDDAAKRPPVGEEKEKPRK